MSSEGRSVVFVLGAGASHPYGMPLGTKLAEELKTNREIRVNRFRELGCLDWLRSELGIDSQDEMIEWLTSFGERFARSGAETIDEFIGLYKNESYGRIAAALSAVVIAESERSATGQYLEPHGWYRRLFHLWCAEGGEFSSAFRVVTFNYDRTLEWAMASQLFGRTGLKWELCLGRVKDLPIAHVHGKVMGKFFHLPGSSSAADIDGECIRGTASSIRLRSPDGYLSGGEHESEIRRARSWIESSEVVVFMGFGFHPPNCDVLGFASAENWNGKANAVLSTRVAMSERAETWLRAYFGNRLHLPENDCDCEKLIADHLLPMLKR